MTTLFPLPDAGRVKMMLGMLYEGLTVKPSAAVDFSAASGAYIGVFNSDEGVPVALCGFDMQLAASASASLTMMPLNVMKDATKSKQLTDGMVANLVEVMNICTRLLLTDTSPHLRLGKVHPIQSLPVDAAALIRGAKGRVCFEVSVPKYGAGVLSLLSA